jgi:muconolactone delta-isomerase
LAGSSVFRSFFLKRVSADLTVFWGRSFFSGILSIFFSQPTIFRNFARLLKSTIVFVPIQRERNKNLSINKMENTNMQFMVDFTMPKELPEEFISLIPRQRIAVNKLLSEGKLLNYALALEHGKLWAVFSVDSESELLDIVYGLPLTDFMKVRISELTFYNALQPFTATFSVN